MLLSLTVSFAQKPKENVDTVKCYGITELRDITACFVELEACDTLLANAKMMLANRDTMIKEKDKEIMLVNGQSLFKDKIIDVKNEEILQLTKDLNKANKHKQLLLLGWGSTNLVLTGFIIFFAIK